MASYSVHEFLGDGVLKEIMQKLADDGWDDVPTLKMMQPEDMEAIDLTDPQRDALELRIYLHDRSLMEYADKIEASGKNLPELLSTNPTELMFQFDMKKADASRFTDRSLACGIKMPPTYALKAGKRVVSTETTTTTTSKDDTSITSVADSKLQGCDFDTDQGMEKNKPLNNAMYAQNEPSMTTTTTTGNSTTDGFQPPFLLRPIEESKQFGESKGIFRAQQQQLSPRNVFGFARRGGSNDVVAEEVVNVTQLSVLENIVLRKLRPVHNTGGAHDANMSQQQMHNMPSTPFKASELWATKPTLVFCLRRPGCVMCRGEAHQLYARKPIFNALGVQLAVVLNEDIESEVNAFWPHYWAGIVLVDESREFFKALGGGKLRKGSIITGFVLNSRAQQNWKRAMATGIPYNLVGEGTIKGGLYILGSGKTGVVYQFIERNFGDWAPLDEVIKACETLSS